MFVDIVVPKNNEKELVKMAARLGIDGLCFLYTSPSDTRRAEKLNADMQIFTTSLQKPTGIAISKKDVNADVAFDLDDIPSVSKRVGFSFSAVAQAKHMSRHIRKIQKQIKMCRGKSIEIVLASLAGNPYDMRSAHDMLSLFICFGLTPGEAY